MKSDSQGTKEETFIQTGRRGRDGQPGAEDSWRGSSWRTGWWKNLWVGKPGGTTGEWHRAHNPGLQHREIKPQILWLKKPVKVVSVGETPSFTGEFVGETHRALECTQNYPPRNQHQKGPISGGSDWKMAKSRASSIVPSQTPTHVQNHNTPTWVVLLWPISTAPPLTT